MGNNLIHFSLKMDHAITAWFGPAGTHDGYWRIKTIQEINDILKGQNIIGFIKKKGQTV